MTSTTHDTVTDSAEKFTGLCHLFETIDCGNATLTAAHAGDVLYYDANNTVCDQSRMLTRAVFAYLGLRIGDQAADELIDDVDRAMRGGEGSLTRDYHEEQEQRLTSAREQLGLIDDLPGDTPWTEARRILAERLNERTSE